MWPVHMALLGLGNKKEKTTPCRTMDNHADGAEEKKDDPKFISNTSALWTDWLSWFCPS